MNLLPLLERATDLRRVVTVLGGGKEGPIVADQLGGVGLSMMSARAHISSMVTIALEEIAKKSRGVSFIHDFPGAVKTAILDDLKGIFPMIARSVFKILAPFICIPIEESGERHLFLATSAKYSAPSTNSSNGSGVPLDKDDALATGTNGTLESGVYSIGSDGESSGPKIEKLLAEIRNSGLAEKVWQHTESEFTRITG